MLSKLPELPRRIRPYLVMGDLNEPVPVVKGPFRLHGITDGTLDADLFYRWVPSSRVEFEGSYSVSHVPLDDHSWTLEGEGESRFSAPVLITQTTVGSQSSRVRGVVRRELAVGAKQFQLMYPARTLGRNRYRDAHRQRPPRGSWRTRNRLVRQYLKPATHPAPTGRQLSARSCHVTSCSWHERHAATKLEFSNLPGTKKHQHKKMSKIFNGSLQVILTPQIKIGADLKHHLWRCKYIYW